MDGGGRTTSQACGLIQASAYGVLRPLSAHGDLVQQENFHLNEGLHLLVIDLRQVQLCLQFDVEFEEAVQRRSGHVGAWGSVRLGSRAAHEI